MKRDQRWDFCFRFGCRLRLWQFLIQGMRYGDPRLVDVDLSFDIKISKHAPEAGGDPFGIVSGLIMVFFAPRHFADRLMFVIARKFNDVFLDSNGGIFGKTLECHQVGVQRHCFAGGRDTSQDKAQKIEDQKEPSESWNCEENEEKIIDWDRLIACGFDEQLIAEIIPTYIADSAKHLEGLNSAVKDANVKDVKFYAHAIKGTARNIGAAELSEIVCRLEKMAIKEDLTGADELLQKITTQFNKIQSAISKPNWLKTLKEQSTNKVEI